MAFQVVQQCHIEVLKPVQADSAESRVACSVCLMQLDTAICSNVQLHSLQQAMSQLLQGSSGGSSRAAMPHAGAKACTASCVSLSVGIYMRHSQLSRSTFFNSCRNQSSCTCPWHWHFRRCLNLKDVFDAALQLQRPHIHTQYALLT